MNKSSKTAAAAAAAISLFAAGSMTPKSVPMAEGALTRNTPVYTVPVYQNIEVKTGDLVTAVVSVNGKIHRIDTLSAAEKADLFVKFILVGKR
jgi:hypothetical protein